MASLFGPGREYMPMSKSKWWDMEWKKKFKSDRGMQPSFTASLLERNPKPTPEEELTYKWASVGLYGDNFRGWIVLSDDVLVSQGAEPGVRGAAQSSREIMHDSAAYLDPYEFKPERFLVPSEDPKLNPDPCRYAFGYFLAEDAMFIAVVTTLAVFAIAPAKTTTKEVEYMSAIISSLAYRPKTRDSIYMNQISS
ncbi:hypothetical protein B0H17DRAFT_1135821 [Mycena rosella]|uniref:Uncharacterized protein n=1 Tax=Mycena rosella TaxID=1033263 RepID=A0AAD7GF62_MYCRO|nr:hypothetical protein B0H17DRAFT_1135821 [Mycena rosella]